VRFNADSLHDLFGPVNQIVTLSELLLKKERERLDAQGENLVGFILEAAGRLQTLAGGLKTYMRVAGAPGPHGACDTNELLAGAQAAIHSQLAASGAKVTHDALPAVECDAGQIDYVFRSLLENAVKFQGEERPEIHVSAFAEDGRWVFSVRDNGIGIDPRYSERIFGLFKRINKDANPGAGVGLAISRHVVELHGGRMWVESAPGKGATFFFSLPKA